MDVAEEQEFSSTDEKCLSRGAGIFFRTYVVDLADDGKEEIILESNSAGTCATRLSEVRVYQVVGAAISKVVQENYTDIKFAKGQGLSIHSFEEHDRGQLVPIDKSFFGAKAARSSGGY